MTDEEREITPENETADVVENEFPDAAELEALEAETTEAEETATDEFDDHLELPALPSLDTQGLNVDEALASLASLNELALGQELSTMEAEAVVATEIREEPRFEPSIPIPPMTTLQRGQMASVLPALLLIGVGVWLTFLLTTSDTTPNATHIITIGLAGLGVILIAQWLSSQRWARGALLFGLSSLLSAGIFLYLTLPNSMGASRGWPLFVAGIGVAFLLTTFLAPTDRRQLAIGLVILVAGLAALGVTMGYIGGAIITTVSSFWPVVVGAVLVILALPFIFKKRE